MLNPEEQIPFRECPVFNAVVEANNFFSEVGTALCRPRRGLIRLLSEWLQLRRVYDALRREYVLSLCERRDSSLLQDCYSNSMVAPDCAKFVCRTYARCLTEKFAILRSEWPSLTQNRIRSGMTAPSQQHFEVYGVTLAAVRFSNKEI
jgi:hypothetical protein